MLHLRVIAPVDLSTEVVDLLSAEAGVTHLAVLPGAARQPPGDLILCDVVRESADRVLRELRRIGVDTSGGIAADDVELTISAAADRAAEEAPAVARTRWSGTRSPRRPASRRNCPAPTSC